MHSSNYRFTLDLHSTVSQISLPVTKGDTSRAFNISLSDGGLPYTIEDGCIAMITFKRPGGTVLEDFCPIERNILITYKFSEKTAAEEGIHTCEIILYDAAGEILASPWFTMIVTERAVTNYDIDISAEDYTAIDAMLAKEVERQEAETARQSAETERQKAEEERQSAETERQQAESNRETQYEAAEELREQRFDDKQSERETSYTESEVLRNSRYEVAEGVRWEDFNSNETERNNAYNEAEAERNSRYETAEGTRQGDFDNNETMRKDAYTEAEAARESAFYEAENLRAEAENARVEAEETRKTTEAYRDSAEKARGLAENERNTAENTRKAQEDARQSAETERQQAESNRETQYEAAEELREQHFEEEQFRRETSYTEAEASRNLQYETAEGTRQGDFDNNEARRQSAEKERDQAEKRRNELTEGFDRRITQLESRINPKYFITDDSAAYNKLSPGNACPYIQLHNVGSNYIPPNVASKNLLDPSLFINATTDEDGRVYCPEGTVVNTSSFTLPEGTYTISSSGETIALSGTGITDDYEGWGNPENEHTFKVEENNSISVTIAGDYSGGGRYSAIMLNKGTGALSYEPYKGAERMAAPVKYCDNLLPFSYYGKSTTIKGITFTVNDNGTITLNGTNTEANDVELRLDTTFSLEAGTYTMKGSGNYYVVFRISDGIAAKDAGSRNFTFTISQKTEYNAIVYVRPEATLSNFVVMPMINKGETSLPYEPYYEGTKSTKLTAIEHYGANLVDDVVLFESFGFKKQANGYWLGSQKLKPIFVNTEGKSGVISISFKGKLITTMSETNSPLAFYAEYTDGTGAWIWQLAFTKNDNGYITKNAATDATKTVKEIRYGYGVAGTYEIKDLIINWGVAAPYQPYSAEAIFTYEIPEEIKNLPGYGMGTIDFENKKFIQLASSSDHLPSPIEHDISAALADFDNILEIQAGGTLRFVNEAKAALPSSFTYLAKEDSIV